MCIYIMYIYDVGDIVYEHSVYVVCLYVWNMFVMCVCVYVCVCIMHMCFVCGASGRQCQEEEQPPQGYLTPY